MPQIPTTIDFKPVGGSTSITSIAAGQSFDVLITMSGTDTVDTSVTLTPDPTAPVSPGHGVSWPRAVVVDAGQTTVRTTVASSSSGGGQSVTFTASANSGSAQGTISIT